MKKILSIIILFLSTTTLSANDRNVELDKLFLELKKNSSLLISMNSDDHERIIFKKKFFSNQ